MMKKRGYTTDFILLRVFKGVNYGIISQFIADYVVLIYFHTDNRITTEVEILQAPSYIAASVSGAISGYVSLYFDSYITAIVSLVSYTYAFNFVSNQLGEEDADIDINDMITDIGAIIILITIFDPRVMTSYNDNKKGIHSNTSTNSLFQNLLISIVTTVYFAYSTEAQIAINQE